MMPWPPLAITAECRHLSEVAAGQTHGHGRRLLPSGQKDTNHFNAGVCGSHDDSEKKPLAGFWKGIQSAQLPMRGDANQRPAWPLLTLKVGAWRFAQTGTGLSPRPYLDIELKSKCWGFEKCFGSGRV